MTVETGLPARSTPGKRLLLGAAGGLSATDSEVMLGRSDFWGVPINAERGRSPQGQHECR